MAYLFIVISLYISAGILIGVALYAWRRGEESVAMAFAFAMALSAAWAFTYALDISSSVLAEKILWMRVRLSFIAFIPAAWFLVTCYYLHLENLLTRRWLVAVFFFPVSTFLIIWFGGDTHLYRYDFHLETINQLVILHWTNGGWYWAHILYAYLTVILLTSSLLRKLRRASQAERQNSLILLATILLPLVTDALYQLNITPLPGYNITPNVFIITGLVMGWVLFRFKLFDILPIARSTLIENLADAVFVLDEQSHVVDVNPAGLKMLDTSRFDVVGKPASKVFAHWPHLVADYQNKLTAKEQIKVQGDLGETEYWEVVICPLQTGSGRISGRLLTLHDITELKQIEIRLSLFFQAVEQSPTTVVITDTVGRIEYVNREFVELTGYAPQEVRGKKTNILKSGETSEEVYRSLWNTIKTGGEWRGEFHNKKKSGGLYWESALITPVIDSLGNITHFLALMEDVTAQKAAREALRKSETLYHTLVEALPIAIFSKDLQGKYTFANELFCKAVGEKIENIIGHTDSEMMPEKAEKFRVDDEHVLQYGYPYEAIEQHHQPDGRIIYTQVVKVPIRDSQGERIGIQGLVWDITDSKRVEIEVKQRLNELATITAISQAATTQLDLKALIDLVGEKILNLFDVQAAFIALHDKQTGIISFPFLSYFDEKTDTETLNFGSGLTSRVIELGQSVVINTDYPRRSAELGVVNRHGTKPDEETPKSWLGVPVIVNKETIGVISVQNFDRENAFRETEVRLLSTIAANVGIAIQNARLYESAQMEIKERMRVEEILRHLVQELNVINEVSQAAASQLDLEQLIVFSGTKIQEIFEARSVFISLHDREKGIFHTPYWTINRERVSPQPIQYGQGLSSIVVNSREPLLISENFETRGKALGIVPQFAGQYGFPKTWLGVPILVGREAIGLISMQDYEKEFAYTEDDVRLLMTIGANIGVAIQNARLFEKAQDELAERKSTGQKLQQQLNKIKSLQAQLHEQAMRDPLTNLFNRRYFQETLSRELSRAEREKSSLGIIIMDIDWFKSVNDTHGHATGDKFIVALAELLCRLTRHSDVACRYGGEEFIVMMPRSTLDIATARAELIRQKFAEIRVEHAGELLQATISLGVALYPLHGSIGPEIIQHADQALYSAKAGGRNRVVVTKAP